MQLKFDIKDISTYRSELMGWAILWIMMLHFTFTQAKPLGFIAQYGYAGVDIFMMVSGLGLYFSLDKDSRLSHFYKKRLLRILPTYYLLGIFGSLLLYHDTLPQYLFRYSTLGFWTGGLYAEWYIPSIVFLYALAPFIKQFFDKRRFILIGAVCLFLLITSYIVVEGKYVGKGEAHFFLLYRTPAFIFGMACAYWLRNHVNNKYYYMTLAVGIPIFALLYRHHHEVYNYKYFSVLFLLPLFVTCFTTLSKTCTWLNPLISEIGKASLEVYLIQGMFFHAILTGLIAFPASLHDLITVGFIILSSVLGITAHWLINKAGINSLF